VLNVAGHRLGTAEIESALVAFPGCAEAAVVGAPHDIKGYADAWGRRGCVLTRGPQHGDLCILYAA
jgi:acyl-CoA synthetase (AMP-forming)/AMP-acid ligase II